MFLYKIDFYKIKEILNLYHQKIYYYNNNFYLEIINKIDDKFFNILSEFSEITYKNNLNIVNNGIKIYI